jgi:hypothetical protein
MIDHVGTAARLTVIARQSAGECLEETDIGIIPAHGCRVSAMLVRYLQRFWLKRVRHRERTNPRPSERAGSRLGASVTYLPERNKRALKEPSCCNAVGRR